MYLRVCRQVLVHYSKRFFKENFLETILSIDYDRVSSVSQHESLVSEGCQSLIRIDHAALTSNRCSRSSSNDSLIYGLVEIHVAMWRVLFSCSSAGADCIEWVCVLPTFESGFLSARFESNSCHCWSRSSRFSRLPVDKHSISKIETMMECFLADKTITLHDLANNGLLQLDQIRSYNPSSVLFTQSNNDDDDQGKESEERFLDELDVSSRRPPSKSTDQHSLPKRPTDSSVSVKSLSTKNSRSSKSFSDDRQRKSSFSMETHHEIRPTRTPSSKPQRRQTLVDGASRLANPSSGKKPSPKCDPQLPSLVTPSLLSTCVLESNDNFLNLLECNQVPNDYDNGHTCQERRRWENSTRFVLRSLPFDFLWNLP